MLSDTDDDTDDDSQISEKSLLTDLLFVFMYICLNRSQSYRVIGKLPNRLQTNYNAVMQKILYIEDHPSVFTRMYRVTPSAFDTILSIIGPAITTENTRARNIVPR